MGSSNPLGYPACMLALDLHHYSIILIIHPSHLVHYPGAPARKASGSERGYSVAELREGRPAYQQGSMPLGRQGQREESTQ